MNGRRSRISDGRPLAGLVLAAAVGILAPACGLGTATEPNETTDDGDDQPRPAPWDDWLRITSVRPDTDRLSTNPTLAIRFNAYLEDDSFQTFNAASLESGGLSYGGWTEYAMVDKTLVWQSRSTIPNKLDVKLKVSDNLESVTGAPMERRSGLADWSVSSDVEADPPDLESSSESSGSRWRRIQSIFERRCTGCHRDPQWGLNPLTYDSLVGRSSSQVDRLLVRPYDPADSYLMHKVLWDYPSRRHQAQPPPWSARGEELPRGQLRLIEGWIDAGAPK